jgi:alpha-L-fucosidase 2
MGWKMALWARLFDGNRANKVFKNYLQEQCYPQLFAKCGNPLQIDGTMGVAAGITEMLVQSHEGIIDVLPALPDEWKDGQLDGVCVRGGFELNLKWKDHVFTEIEILSKAGRICQINTGANVVVTENGKSVALKTNKDGSVEFKTSEGKRYILTRK